MALILGIGDDGEEVFSPIKELRNRSGIPLDFLHDHVHWLGRMRSLSCARLGQLGEGFLLLPLAHTQVLSRLTCASSVLFDLQ